ncbi:uncharacterized protein LOC128988667 isoform X3 [Macrosteles quadrilineatus]|uniref:uncharacterized protein LOC128988667 isoform X3 n=1 Tax=Macrosteles quadrilineatus TaxID=74068 RepID=UPI0023E0FDDB|nr:uncharacterized protein LOC128988667 isoform X3 [Macrosteles quadrilineatus]
MKIWSVSCTLAVLLLVVTAQRRGSRRFDLSQASDSPAEDEDELSSTRSHRFERQRQSAEPDSDRGPISRSRSRTVETEAQVDSRRPGSRQRESVVDDSNLRQGSRRGKGLTLRSRSEPEEENHLSTERTRSRTNKEERRNGFPSRLDSDVISHTESATVRSQNINSRFSDKEKTKSRNENNFTRSSPVERRPLLPITSISPEDVTFPSRSRSRQTKAPEEAITSEPKGNSRNLQRSSEGTRLRSRTLEQNFPSRSSSRGTTRSRVPEVTSGTSTPSRTRSEFSPLRRKPIDLPGQDVESKIFSRRRNLAEEKVKTTIDDSSSKTGFVSDKVKSTLPVTSEGFTELPLYSSNAGTEEVINSDIPVNKQIENVVDALPTASNDALTLLPNEVLQSTLHANVRDRSKPQDSPLKNNDNTGLTKALHARSRGQERPSENESENVSRSRTRQRSKESDSESRKPTNRGRISTSEPAQGLSTARERFSPRSRGNLSNRESEQKEVDASNTRTRAQVRFPTRTSAESRGSAESSTEGSTVNRGRATSVNIATPTVELQTESSPIRSPSRSGGRRTLPKPTADLEPTAKPSRGRGQVKQGKLNDNEKGSGSGKDEDVSEDDNYPEVYKQLKKAGNGPKEILALLKAKKKQREAQQAQRRQQQQSATAEATTAATFFSDLNTEEDNVKPSIESSLRRRPSEKFSREAESSATERSSSRSASRQRSLTSRGSRNYNDLGKAEEEVLVNTQSVRTGTDSKDYKKLLEERKKKYSTIPRENDFDQDKENGVEIKSEKPSYSKDYLKSLNDLGLDPKTLGPTEPTTERERFVPSSRRTKSYSYRASTEQISDEVLNTSTFKPRYQLYQAKNRKKYLNKLGGKESLGSKEETSIESVLDEEVDQKVKKLRFGASSRPPYTPPRRVTTPLPPPRLSARRPGRFTPSSISVAFDKPDDQEPVTIQVFDLEARAPKLESASLVTEASSTAMTSSSETPSMEGSSEQSSSEASSEDSSVETSVTESPLENSTPTSMASTEATSTTISSTTTTTESTTFSTTTTTTTQKPTTTTKKPTTTTKKPTQKPKPKAATTQKTVTTKATTTSTSPTPITTQQTTTTTTEIPQPSPTTTTTPEPTTTPQPTTTTPKPTTTLKPTTPKPTTPKPTTPKPTTPKPTTPKPTTPKPTTPKPSTPKPTTPKKPSTTTPTTTTTTTTTSTTTTTTPSTATEKNIEPMIVSGVESALSSPSSPKSETKENDEDCDICGDEVSSSSKATPSNGLSEDDVALLNNLLRLQPSDSERSASVDSSSSLPPSGPEDDDIANRIIQLAIERAQSTTASPVSVSVSTDGLDLQQLSSSPQPSFERDGKSIAPPMMDSMAVETSPPPKPGGKISLWVVPEGENEQTTKAPQKLSPEEEQVLTALLAAPQSPSSISVRDQLLLAELLAAGQNNNQGGQISTTKRPRKKKRPSSTPPPPPPPLSPLAALFGAGGRGGGLFASGAAPPTGSGEEGDASARPQQGGLLVNAAINITRAVSQFMGLVLQSAAQSFSTFLASRTRNFADYVARGGAIS